MKENIYFVKKHIYLFRNHCLEMSRWHFCVRLMEEVSNHKLCNEIQEYKMLEWYWTWKVTLNPTLLYNVSISSTFYTQVFRTKVFCAAFLCYVLALANGFWQKMALSYEKCTYKMLKKLTNANVVNVFRKTPLDFLAIPNLQDNVPHKL